MTNIKIIIEHLEPRLWPWVRFEYEQLAKYVNAFIGKNNLIFTHVKKAPEWLSALGECQTKRAFEYIPQDARVCILDPTATQILTPEDANQFDYVIIGGILGDKEFNGRTGKELSITLPNAQLRHLGPKQFSTDNAVYVTTRILAGLPFEKFTFVDAVEIEINEYESVELPFRYPILKDQPLMNPKLLQHLIKKRSF
jgi:ribosome biogenesis SPOUT family RNA methylase Rps3